MKLCGTQGFSLVLRGWSVSDRGRGRRTDYSWLNFGDDELIQDLGTGAGIFGSTGLVIERGSTLMRVRGRIGITLDTGGVGEHAMILAGLLLVNADTFAAGAAPELFGNQQDDASWLWQGQLYAGEATVGLETFVGTSLEVDSKAMRKVKSDQTLALVHQAPPGLVDDKTGTYDLTWFIHVLVGR